MRCRLRSVEIHTRLEKLRLMLKMHDIFGEVDYRKGKPDYTRRHGGWRSYPYRYAVLVAPSSSAARRFETQRYYETTEFFATLVELEAFVAKLLLESILQDG